MTGHPRGPGGREPRRLLAKTRRTTHTSSTKANMSRRAVVVGIMVAAEMRMSKKKPAPSMYRDYIRGARGNVNPLVSTKEVVGSLHGTI